jgi:excisionase family DNA binding protein
MVVCSYCIALCTLASHLDGGACVTKSFFILGKEKELMVQNSPKEVLLTVGEVARRLRVDGTTVRRWIATGALEAVILPHAGTRRIYRVKQSTLDALLQTSLPD